MALRMLNCITNFYMDWVKAHGEARRVPLLFPLLLCNGDARWSAAQTMAELVESEPGQIFFQRELAAQAAKPLDSGLWPLVDEKKDELSGDEDKEEEAVHAFELPDMHILNVEALLLVKGHSPNLFPCRRGSRRCSCSHSRRRGCSRLRHSRRRCGRQWFVGRRRNGWRLRCRCCSR
jgi:hypothetical protein